MSRPTHNAQQEAVATFKFFESRGFRPSVRFIGKCLRELDLRFDDKQLRMWLKPFSTAVAPRSTASPPHETSTSTAVAPQDTAPAPRLRAYDNVSLVEINASDPSDPQRAPKQPRLRLADPIEIEARRILDAFWPLVAERVQSAMTKTSWRSRNKRTAIDLARSGVDIDRVVAAHSELSRQRGDVVYTLSFVQDFIAKNGPPKVVPMRPRGEDSSPSWLATAIARGEADAERRIAEAKGA